MGSRARSTEATARATTTGWQPISGHLLKHLCILGVVSETKQDATPSPVCRNCGAPLTSPYCGECGQKDADVAQPLTTLVADFFDGTFSLDSRVVRTMALMIGRPGRLTRAYFDGQRTRYMPPLRLFLVCSLLFFATVGLSGRHILRMTANAESVQASDDANVNLVFAFDFDDPASNESSPTRSSTTAPAPSFLIDLDVFPRASDPVTTSMTPEEVEAVVASPTLPAFARRYVADAQNAVMNPQELNASLNVWLPRMMLLLVPVFALVLRLFYWDRRLFLAHHIFFALHFQAFLFVLLTVLLLIAPLYRGFLSALVFLLGGELYLLLSMRRTYRQSWLLTIIKAASVSLIYTAVFVLVLLLTLWAASHGL